MERKNKEWSLPAHVASANGIVRNPQGEILMVKNNRRGWTLPGGVVEEGETLPEALAREIMEETGIVAEVGELYCIASDTGKYPGYNGVKEIPPKLIFSFFCTSPGGEPRGSDENAESAWVREADLESLLGPDVPAAQRERLLCYREYTGRPFYYAFVKEPEFVIREKRNI